MDYYVYRASLFCGLCADLLKLDLARRGFSPADRAGGSDRYPQGPYACEGPASESDSPQHCDQCGLFLRNRLTTAGHQYVHAALSLGTGRPEVLELWRQHYVPPRGRDC